jgi:predicted permease
MLQDLRLALRSLLRAPGFTAVVVLTLALGIGANTAIFSVLYGVVLRPLPYFEPERLVGLVQTGEGRRDGMAVTYSQFRYLAERSQVFESLSASTSVGLNLLTGTEAARVNGLRVSAGYFQTLGIEPDLGRSFVAEEDQPGGAGAVVLSHGLWQRRFGGDAGVIGRAISLDGQPFTVIGVMPAGFRAQEEAEVWTTLAQVGQTIGSGQNLEVIGRLKPGLSLAAAQAEWQGTVPGFQEVFKESLPGKSGFDLEPYRRLVVGDTQTPVELLFGAIGLVLLIACANVANLVLGRGAARSRELAVRAAIGASRGRLLRQLVTESLVVSLAGGAVGLLLATWGLDALLALVPESLPRSAEIHLDGWALLFTFGLSLLTGLGFGVIPAWQSAQGTLHDSLKAGAGRTTSTVRQGRLRHSLVVLEVALSLILLLGAGLLVQTFANLLHTEPGFDTRHVVAGEIWLTGSGYESTPAVANFYRDLIRRVEAVPGVRSAAVVEAGLPLNRGGNVSAIVNGQAEQRMSVDYRTITTGFFDALGVGMKRGRGFTDGDGTGAPGVAIVNEAFARKYLTARPALGSQVTLGHSDAPREVVGVVGDVRSFIGFPARPTVFIPSAQTPIGFTRIFSSWFPTHIVVRTDGDPAAIQGLLARIVHEADAQVPVGRVRTMEEVLASSLAMERFLMLLLSLFAGLALVLAAVGIYGVISYLVAQRSREIGIRMALGATTRDVQRMVVGRGMRLTSIGIVAGLAGALALTPLLASQLYDVRPIDLPTLALVTAGVGLIALVASYLPARRAAGVDPVVALRQD